MSIQAMNWVIEHSTQKSTNFVTLLMIANHANAEGENSFPSMKTLAKECRTSQRTIQRTIERLEQSGELSVNRSGGRSSHTYTLTKMNVDKVSTLERGQIRKRNVDKSRPNVDKIDANVDIAVSTEPLTVEPKKEPSAHARLMAVHSERLGGKIPDPQAQGAAVKWLLANYDESQAVECYDAKAREGRRWKVSWLTVKSEIGEWLIQRGQPKEKILEDHGDWYTVMGFDGTPSKRFRTPEGLAAISSVSLEEARASWNGQASKTN